MSPRDLLLALVVVVAWGVNFVVIKVGLHGVPPMLLGALRFSLAAVPAVFFVKRPNWRGAGCSRTARRFPSGSSPSCFRRCTSACPRASHPSCCRRRRFSR